MAEMSAYRLIALLNAHALRRKVLGESCDDAAGVRGLADLGTASARGMNPTDTTGALGGL
jgi:hypothetical protein